jgi:diacylglycerol kinase
MVVLCRIKCQFCKDIEKHAGMKSTKFTVSARLRGFRHAFRGLKWLVKEEHNAWIHLAVTIVLIPACIWLRLTPAEWIIIIFCIGLVLSMELVNSAVERLADRIDTGPDQLIGQAKDMAAAAVLISAVCSAIIGLIILVPKFLHAIGL